MGAIVQRFGTAGSALRAFSGGSDLLLFRRDAVQARRAHSEIVAAVRNGTIPMARLDASVRRVLRAKDAVGLLSDVPADMDVPDSPEIVASDVARQSITLIQDGPMLPVRSVDHPRICVVQPRLREIAGQEIVVPVTGPATLADAVRALHPAIQVVEVGLDPPRPERLAASECARSAGLVIVGTYNTGMFASQPILLDALRLADVPIIVVALRLPYDFSVVGEIDAFVTGYSMRPASLQAVARTIFGVSGAAPTGSLPVPLGKSYPVGYQYPTPDAWLFPQP
jgi:beta-N-acetylhexosaminidase